MTRGIRNNNPGNIRHSTQKWRGEIKGSDKAFKSFETMAWGIRAIFHLLYNYQQLHGLRTLNTIIARWAPEHENNTQNYVRFVSERSGVAPTSSITATNRDVMIPIVDAMIRMENGCSVPMSEIEAGWNLFIANRH